jgi:putative ABC transport system permease protein
VLQHLKFACRLLRKNLSFTLVAATTLALGIGATTAVFTLVDAVLLRPLAYQNPTQLVSIAADEPGAGGSNVGFNPLELDDLRNRAEMFDQVSAVWPVSANVTGGDHPERIELLATSPSYFSILGVAPQLGRTFGPEDDALGFADAVVMSDAAWRRLFGGDRSVLGHRVYLDGDAYTIVGVMPPGFRHPGRTVAADVDFWGTAGYVADPFPHPPRREQRFIPEAIGRLKHGVSPTVAQAKLDNLVRQLHQEYPNVYASTSGWTVHLTSLDEIVVGKTRSLLWVLLAAVAAILLIGCINVANLLLSRASSREREIAVRLALGARRRDLIVQLLTESFVLSLIATAAGVLIGWAMLHTMIAIAGAKLPRIHEIGLNLDVLLFLIALAMVTAVLFGLAPALQSSSPNLASSLGGGTRGGGPSLRQNHFREGLVIAEVGMSLVLLAGAGLLVRTLWHLINVDAGFNPVNVEVASIWLPVPNHPELDPYRKPEQRLAFNREVLRRVMQIPTVEEAALSGSLPLTGNQFVGRIAIEGRNADTNNAPNLAAVVVSPGYFHALQTPLVSGRTFAESDDVTGDGVVIVDHAAATRLWPGENAIGHRVGTAFNVSKTRWFTIVGVIADIKQAGLDAPPTPHIYFSLYQLGPRSLSVVARVRSTGRDGEEASLTRVGEQIKQEVRAVNPDLPVFGIQPMTDLVSASLTARRFSAQLIGAFSVLALVLAAIGVYGVIAYWVAQRTRELGIRMALGAQPEDLLKLVLARGMRLAGFGVLAGLAAAIAIAPLLRSQVYGISLLDPLVFASVPALLLGVALAAGYLPALRAMRVDPVVALRHD